jgi:hypothetical protein
MKQLAELETLMSPTNNYKTYRAELEELIQDPAKPSFIPVLGLFLKDLLFLNDGNPKMLSNEQNVALLNVDKLLVLYTKITSVTQGASGSSTTDDKNVYISYCANLRALKEQALYKYSTLCEPKEGDDVLRLREKWMNMK